jgi:uncharacterized membrane protein
MDNPYQAGELTPELAAEERRRPKVWHALLTAYAVFHVFALFGTWTGALIAPTERQEFLPLNNAWHVLQMVVLGPVLYFPFVVLDPLIAHAFHHESLMFFRWARTVVALLIPIMGMRYGLSRRREVLWLIGIVSFAVFLSFVLSFARDRRAHQRSAREAPGPGLVPAVASLSPRLRAPA